MATDPLLDPRTLAALLRERGLPPLDRFGQHFLIDPTVLAAIVDAIDPAPDIPLIEIGAGVGVLTRALANKKQETGNRKQDLAPLVTVELDRRLVPLLKERVQVFPCVRVVQGDILRLTPQDLLESSLHPHAYDVAGNIPYNITAKLLRHVLGWQPQPRKITFLLDHAVADRVTAAPPDMSVLAISVQVYAEPRIVLPKIPPTAFLPPPAVVSALVRFDVRPTPLVPREDTERFFRLVRAGFSQKRKTLQNALRATWRTPPVETASVLTRAGIDPGRRAETLSIAEWRALLRTVRANG